MDDEVTIAAVRIEISGVHAERCASCLAGLAVTVLSAANVRLHMPRAGRHGQVDRHAVVSSRAAPCSEAKFGQLIRIRRPSRTVS